MQIVMSKIPKEFGILMKKKKVPCLQIGIIEARKNSFYLEVIVKRPERYSNSKLLKKIPKSYKGLRVKIV
jgi:hypothetical protein